MSDLVQVAQSAQNSVAEHRHYLHQCPETRWEENQTLGYIQATVEAITPHNCKVVVLNGYSGGLVVNVDFASTPESDLILLRADVDALPIPEETGLSYASKVAGVSHACGHDTHAAMLLGAFKLIVEGKVKPTHSLRFAWQRAEEGPGSQPTPVSGGDVLIQEGVLNGITTVHALHIRSTFAKGIFYSRQHQISGNSDRMLMTVKAPGGHVINPRSGANALRIADGLSSELDQFMKEHFGSQPFSVEPAVTLAGTGWGSSNIMPSHAERYFALRTLINETKRNQLHSDLKKHFAGFVHQVSDGKASVEVEIRKGHPAMINTDFEAVRGILQTAGQSVKLCPAELGGEDFAYYLQGVPGSFWYLGAGGEDQPDHHTPLFNPDESVFWQGVLFWLLLATN